jgi:hypothetical protein
MKGTHIMADDIVTTHHSDPARKRVQLADAKRRDDALRSITHQLEAIFGALVLFVRYERNEITRDEAHQEWPDFDADCLPDVYRALAIRGAALNIAMMNALVDEISTDDLERVVFNG